MLIPDDVFAEAAAEQGPITGGAMGLIVVNLESTVAQYWHAFEFRWASFCDDATAEVPRVFTTMKLARRRIERERHACPEADVRLAFRHHPDYYESQPPVIKYMKMGRRFGGSVQQ